MKAPLLFLVTAAVAYAAPATSAPATLSKEGDLTTIMLKPDAEERLRLKTVAVERRSVAATRLFSGEVVRSLGTDLKSNAPVLGGSLDELLRVADLQAVADGRVLQAQTQLDAAKIALDRAQKVLESEAGSVRAVDEAKAAHTLATVALNTAQAQRALLGAPVGVAGAAPHFWIRTAIYTGEAALLDAAANASVRPLTASSGGQSVAPVQGPLTANAATATIDWYYDVPAGSTLRAGERVAMEIPTMGGRNERLVVPFSAVLHDIHGGQWVYEAVAPHTYTRRRVQVERLAGADAVLSSGPAVGATIVTDGAAELFGTEFMTGK